VSCDYQSGQSVAGYVAKLEPMNVEFEGDLWYWRGPAPFFFVTIPAEHCDFLRAASKFVTYGWGMIPVVVRIGGTEWTTSLFPKNGGYILPVKDRVRKAEALEEGSTARVALDVKPGS